MRRDTYDLAGAGPDMSVQFENSDHDPRTTVFLRVCDLTAFEQLIGGDAMFDVYLLADTAPFPKSESRIPLLMDREAARPSELSRLEAAGQLDLTGLDRATLDEVRRRF